MQESQSNNREQGGRGQVVVSTPSAQKVCYTNKHGTQQSRCNQYSRYGMDEELDKEGSYQLYKASRLQQSVCQLGGIVDKCLPLFQITEIICTS